MERTKVGTTTLARVLLAVKLGRDLLPTEVVHHIDGNELNDSMDNLEVMSSTEHKTLHGTGRSHTEETKQKLSRMHSGKVLSEEHKAAISRTMKTNHRYRYQGGTDAGIN